MQDAHIDIQDAMYKCKMMRISFSSASSCKVQTAHRGLTTVKCIVKSRKSLVKIQRFRHA